jgi:DNA-binding NarL/FixJ family response regulator
LKEATTPKILLIDDHPVIRAGLKRSLTDAGLICCGEAATRAEAYAQIAHTSPDGVILDLNLPDGSGLDIVQWIRKHSKEMAIVILTMSDEESQILAAMHAGASSFVNKSAPLSEVIANLRSALLTPKSLSAPGLVQAIKNSAQADLLTPRELIVLQALLESGTNRELAKSLHISEATFKTHLAAIYRKFGVTTRLEAIKKAQSINLL